MQENGCARLQLQMTSKAAVVHFLQWSQKSQLTLTTLNPVKPAVAEELSSHHTVLAGRIGLQEDRFWSHKNSGAVRQ